jgi:GntR family transcriptional regulator
MVKATPKYARIKQHVMRDIATHGNNKLLPSENQLARQFQVSRMTARRALIELENEGFAHRIPGKGTFSRKRHFTQGFFRVHSFLKWAEDHKAAPRITVLKACLADPPPDVAAKLGSDQAIYFCRLLYLDDEPVTYENRYLRKDLCNGILRENLTDESVNEILIHKFNLPMTKVWQRLEAVGLPAEAAAFFNVAEGDPAFRMERLSYSFDEPVNWVEYFRRGDAYAFEDTFYPQQDNLNDFSASQG